MQSPVAVQDKKDFIQWFLNHYHLQKRESVWILHYLINHPKILSNVHFVRDAKFCPRSLIMTTNCSKDVTFRFYKEHLVTTNAEKAFHDIRLNHDEALYIQLNFNQSNQSPMYASVLVENPYLPSGYYTTKNDQKDAARLLNQSLITYKKNSLKKKIDDSLDQMNEQEFIKLTDELFNLEND